MNMSVSATSVGVCSVDSGGLVTFTGKPGSCTVEVTPVAADGSTGTTTILQTITVAPLDLSGVLTNQVGVLAPVVDQIVSIAQPIRVTMPPGSSIVKVTVNGVVVAATVDATGKVTLPFLIGPKDRVLVYASVNGQSIPIEIAPENSRINLANVNFDFAKSTLTKNAKKILSQVALDVRQHGFTKITLVGFTDVLTGPRFSNQALSDARAAAVHAYLTSLLGGRAVTISLSGKGAADPIIRSRAAAARAVNRRVEIIVQ